MIKEIRSRNLQSETDVPIIMQKDGVEKRTFNMENQPVVNIREIINDSDDNYSWCRRVVDTENNSATLIAQKPGEGNRLHNHPNWNEWWYILQGTWKWEVEGKEYIVKQDDIVFIKKGSWHKITAIGNEIAIRLAVSRGDVPHVYK
jgi:quercetin dioxygenase-like cupin family protein